MVAGKAIPCIDAGPTPRFVKTRGTVNTPAQQTYSPYTVDIVTTEGGFENLEKPWNDLFEEGGMSVFQSFEWQRTWWKHYGEKNPWMRLFVLVVRREGLVAGIAPCCIETLTSLGVLHVRCLSLLGRGKSDYLDVIVRKGSEADCAEVFARALWSSREEFDMLFIEDISDRSRSLIPLYEGLRRSGFTGDRFISEYCPRTSFAATWPETCVSLPWTGHSRMERKQRQLATRHKAEIEFSGPESPLEPDVDDFMALHQERWNAIGKSGLFAEHKFAAFFREALGRIRARGWLVFAFMRLEGKRAAAICGFQFRDEFAYYLNGLGEAGAAKQLSPGLVLHVLCMEQMFQRGVRTYDFLRGIEKYKYDLGGVDVPNWTLLMYSHPGSLVKKKHRIYLLQVAFVRRMRQEWSMVRRERGVHGILSGGMARYVVGRARTVLSDARTKARAPEKSVATAESNK
jgi:CelD/BcsL family acetyltransferase involved in cellulose biosynthesis